MFVKLDSEGYIVSYSTYGGIKDGIEVEDEFLNKIDISKFKYYKVVLNSKIKDSYSLIFDEEKYNLDLKNEQSIELNNKYIPSSEYSIAILLKNYLKTNISKMSNQEKLEYSGLYELWIPGNYKIGDIRNYAGQTWECYQAHDNNVYPDINPNNSAWYTFWKPLHGTSLETARPFVKVRGSYDTYKVGEYMIYTDGYTYKCIHETAYSPDEYIQDWEKVIIN